MMDFHGWGLDRAFRVVRRWALVIVAAAAIASLTAFVVSSNLPPEYVATAQLYIAPASNPTVAFQDVVLGTNVARSYVQLMESEVVVRPAMAETGWTDLRDFQQRTRATQVRDTSIINISFSDTDPDRAAATANAIASSFIEQAKKLQSTLSGDTETLLQGQIDLIQKDIRELDDQIAELRSDLLATARPGQPTPSFRADLQAQLIQLDGARQSKQQTLAQLLKTRDDLRLSSVRAQSTVSLWQEATAPAVPVAPRVGLNSLLGGLAGAMVSLLIVLIVTYIDDRITEIEEVLPTLGVAPLGQVHLGVRPDSLTGKLFVRDAPRSPEAESFRSLRTNIQFANVDSPPRSLVITSAMPREGKSVVSANLALAFAQAGIPTVIIDADLRRPSQHRLFGISAATGLTSLLTDAVPFTNVERFQVGPHLHVIPSGPLPPNPAELLSSTKMANLVAHLLRSRPDTVVIIDTSPVFAAADAVALASRADGAVFVVDSGRTHSRVARRAIDQLQRVRAKVFGVVLNKITSASGSYYYYYSSSYYGAPSPQRPARVAEGEGSRPSQG